MKKTRRNVFIVAAIFIICNISAQTTDSLETAFRKGRFLTGLSGSISSTTTDAGNLNSKTTSNNFGINIQSGKFFKNRLLIGGIFQANKISSSGAFTKTTETFYIGPFSNYYFMDNKTGSLFTSLSLGYVRYKDKTELEEIDPLINQATQQLSEGGGLGSIIGFGYSYTINDFIAFDLGVNVNLFWVDIEQKLLPNQTITNTSISSNDVSFSFGFNVILDDFFF
ncbi:hypothetical protein [uncultured Algibacter sp.]|uniref:hypothetical protein n=1 Tax=uncultured Algibacter sp. TaxID=298659 RepID=UPI003216AF48